MDDTSPVLVGRDAELRLLSQALDAAATGRGSSFLLHGVAGSGRSAMLERVRSDAVARSYVVLSTTGVEAERWFPFAALHLLLQPLGDRSGLPGDPAGPGDVHRAGLAVLRLLSARGSRTPIVVLIDDLHWVDEESLAVLGFVTRRVRDHALLVVGAARTHDPHRFRSVEASWIRLGPLPAPDAARMLSRTAPELAPATRDLVLELAAGNPLALAEIPEAMTRAPDDGPAPMTPRLEEAFSAHPGATGRTCRLLLLVLAAEPDASLDLLLEVAAALVGTPVSLDVVQEAVDAGVITVSGVQPAFRHPLSRPATYRRATAADRLAVHRLLAAALRDDPERSLRHEAATALAPDDEVADRLEALADEALRHGRVAAAMTALRRAAPLAGDPQRGTGILIRAAELAEQLSERHHARRLLDRVDLRMAGPVDRGRLLVVSDGAAVELPEVPQLIGDMVAAAGRAHDEGATEVAENLLWRAAMRCSTQNPPDDVRRAVTAELDRWAADPHAPITSAVLAHADPFGRGASVLERLATGGDPADGPAMHYLGSSALALGDYTRCARFFTRAAAVWRRQGRSGMLARSLVSSWVRAHLGQLDQATAEAAEGRELALRAGETNIWLGLTGVAALTATLRGDREAATLMLRELRASPDLPALQLAVDLERQSTGLLALLDGRAAEAYEGLLAVFEPAGPYPVSKWRIVPDLADAASAAGMVGSARQVLAELPDLAERLPSEQMLIANAYASAVLATDDEAEQRYAAALAVLPAAATLVQARLHLHHGRWLHRQRRYLDAREPLRVACAAFDRMDARPWAEAAERQLRAAGEAPRQGARDVRGELTARELQIATLAARGMTNRDIGRQLNVSPRTVGSYLYRIYPRLGIAGRHQLAQALAALT